MGKTRIDLVRFTRVFYTFELRPIFIAFKKEEYPNEVYQYQRSNSMFQTDILLSQRDSNQCLLNLIVAGL